MAGNNGNFCLCCRFGEIPKFSNDFFLEEMIRNSVLVHSEEPDDAQCRAWLSSLKVLKKTLKSLPECYGDTYLVFEYVLPKHRPGTRKAETEEGIRPDVLVVGTDFVTVLEFKQRKLDDDGTVFEGYIKQAQKYVTRLNRYHAASQDRYVAPVVVLTLEKGLLEDRGEAVIVSPDRLAEAIVLLDGETTEALGYPGIRAWLGSEISSDQN